jgi:hypothetical protein
MAPCLFHSPLWLLPPLSHLRYLPLLPQSRYRSFPNHYSSAPTASEDHLRGMRVVGFSPIPSARYSWRSPHRTHGLPPRTRFSNCLNRSSSL